MRTACCLASAFLLLVNSSFGAGDDAVVPPNDLQSTPQAHWRTGCPQTLRRLAFPSNTYHYDGYVVGGGTTFHRQLRYANEGTWGWDYDGVLYPKRIRLGWSHGRRYQGGTGRYTTAGPTHLPAQ